MRRAALLLLLAAGCGDQRTAAVVRADADAGMAPAGADAGAPAADRGFVGVLVSDSVDIAPRFEGQLLRVHVRAGDKVAAGTLVAEIDPAPLREEVRAAEAAARAAEAAAREARVAVSAAEKRLQTEKALYAAGTVSRQVVDNAEMELQTARAARDRASSDAAQERSRLQTARNRLDDASLRAPFSGTVALRHRDPGATVGPGTPVVRLVGEAGLRLRFAMPPERAGQLTVGATVAVDIDTVAEPAAALVRQISPALDPASQMVLAEAELTLDADRLAALRPGLAAWVRPR